MRAVAVHLHCYQPPRDNPWLDVVLRERGAFPFHDWNERITDECYRPLGAARLLDEHGRITDARNLYASCSFNVGPTLHRWLAERAPDVDRAVRAGDAAAAPRHSGHGSAVAHPYVHAILPLADERDRRTLVRWGVTDFRSRYGREPEGIWLPETAVDVATLETLAGEGIGFTIVAPQQVARVRTPGGAWHDVEPATLDPTRPYRVPLPSGRSVTVLVFDGPLSRAVAFDRTLLSDGEALGAALLAGFPDRPGPALRLVATDGETFGHHHRFGEMALATALALVEADPAAELVTLGEFLARFPADHEAQLVEPSAWSCPHGVGRWAADCGCSTSGEPGWNQAWRAPLRSAVDWLRDTVNPPWDRAAGRLLPEPWRARDAYAEVLVAPGPQVRQRFLDRYAAPGAAPAQVWALLELQQHLLKTGTSCGWFFADPAALETAVVLRHAARVVDLARELLGLDVERELVARLAGVRSNDPAQGGGAQLWQAWARDAELDALDVAACWAALAVADPSELPQWLLGREVVVAELAEGAADAAVGPVSTGRVDVVDPATRTREPVAFAAAWGADGGPGVSVWRWPDAGPGAARDRSVADLPDDVVADLLRRCLVADGSLLAAGPPPGRPVDAVLAEAAARGLDLAGPAVADADAVLAAAAEAAPDDPAALVRLDAWAALARTVPAYQGRFAAQNVVLALRDRLPRWEDDPERAAEAAALRRLAGRLGVVLAAPAGAEPDEGAPEPG